MWNTASVDNFSLMFHIDKLSTLQCINSVSNSRSKRNVRFFSFLYFVMMMRENKISLLTNDEEERKFLVLIFSWQILIVFHLIYFNLILSCCRILYYHCIRNENKFLIIMKLGRWKKFFCLKNQQKYKKSFLLFYEICQVLKMLKK